MSWLLMFGILSAACGLLLAPPPDWSLKARTLGTGRVKPMGEPRAASSAAVTEKPGPVPVYDGVGWSASRRRSDAADQFEDLVRLLRELSALLTAGRSGPQLWKDALSRHCPVDGAALPVGHKASRQRTRETPAELNTVMLQQAHGASLLGLSVSGALRTGCRERRTARNRKGTRNGMEITAWLELAACLDVAEVSGAPLAAVLLRLAAALETQADEAALRETSLAGPKATVRLLAWLPALGLGLGVLMGVDPFAILFGNAIGSAALLAGVTFMIVGRCWTAVLMSAASGHK